MMSKGLTRRSLFRLKDPVRPPWALREDAFIETCTRCGDCVASCPEQILVSGRGGYPHVDFSSGGCTFCMKCVEACEPRALDAVGGKTMAWTHRVDIAEACIARKGVECRVCGEACEARAIRFQLRRGAPPLPALDTDACTGCGACIAACPVDAIAVSMGRGSSAD